MVSAIGVAKIFDLKRDQICKLHAMTSSQTFEEKLLWDKATAEWNTSQAWFSM